MNPVSNKASRKADAPQSAYMKNLSSDSVDAQVVEMHQSGASKVTAESVKAIDSFLGETNCQTAGINKGLCGYIHTDQVAVDHGFTGILSTGEAVMNGPVGITAARSVRMNGSRSGIIMAREVHGAKVKTVFLLANRLDAPVETVVDTRSIALFGAAAGLTFSILYGFFRWLRSKS